MTTTLHARPVMAQDVRGEDPATTGRPVQSSFEELGPLLRETTFVVVDLETTGIDPAADAITEIGAVKVRGGEVVGEFATLIDPGRPIPARISRITGITDAMVRGRPGIEPVLSAFLEFAGSSVLVAHNARFDMGFLRAAAVAAGIPWPRFQVVDTVPLARRLVPREEAPNHKLATLAALFSASTTPEHRALADARATVDVLHALFDRLGAWGVTHLGDLAGVTASVPAAVRRKHVLADPLPDGPGVYLFHGPQGEILYVGTSTRSVRRRVRTYFTQGERRKRIRPMLLLAESVSAVPCATPLEAQVRELRLIAEHSPPFNQRSKHPGRMPWIRLSETPSPRLSVVREVADPRSGRVAHIGPYSSRERAQLALDALRTAVQCPHLPSLLPARRDRVDLRPAPECAECSGTASPAPVMAERADVARGSQGMPCTGPAGVTPSEGGEPDRTRSPDAMSRSLEALSRDPSPVVRALSERITRLSRRQEFERAALVRDQLEAFLDGALSAQRLDPLSRCEELVAARRLADGGWEVVVIRHARLAATGISPPGQDPYRTIDALVSLAEHVPAPVAPAPAAHPHESRLLLSWLDAPGTRLVSVSHPLSCPVRGAESVDLVSAVGAGCGPALDDASGGSVA